MSEFGRRAVTECGSLILIADIAIVIRYLRGYAKSLIVIADVVLKHSPHRSTV